MGEVIIRLSSVERERERERERRGGERERERGGREGGGGGGGLKGAVVRRIKHILSVYVCTVYCTRIYVHSASLSSIPHLSLPHSPLMACQMIPHLYQLDTVIIVVTVQSIMYIPSHSISRHGIGRQYVGCYIHT